MMHNILRNETIKKILEYNPKSDINMYVNILEYCDIIESNESLNIEAFNCKVISDDVISLRIGTYYSEIDITECKHFLDVMDNAISANMYTVNRDNPDGAMFVISMDFKIGV